MSAGPLRVPRYPRVVLSTAAASATSAIISDMAGFKDVVFQLTGTFTGYSVQIYGTIDPLSVNQDGSPSASYGLPGVGGSWVPVPSPSEGAESSVVVNPLTSNGQVLPTKVPFVAYAAVATGSSQTGTVTLVAWGVD